MAPKLRIGVDVGMSIQVMGVDWVKPAVRAEIDFDEIPTDKEAEERWAYLWDKQLQPQVDKLLDLMQDELRRRLGPAWSAPPTVAAPVKREDTPAPPPPPPGGAYS